MGLKGWAFPLTKVGPNAFHGDYSGEEDDHKDGGSFLVTCLLPGWKQTWG